MTTLRKTSSARRWAALGAIILSVLAVGIDQTVLNLALPTLARALHASNTDLQWFVAAFSLALCATLLPAGALGDLLGRKKLLIAALVVFGAGSLACAYSVSPGELIAARVLLGIGAAFLIPLPLAVVTVLFEEKERPLAVGIWGGANFLAFPIGPILGGWLLSRYWWGSVFLMNVPVVILGIVAVLFLVPESRSKDRPGLDPLGILLSSIGLAGLTFAVIEAGQNGWGSARTLVPLAAGAVLMVLFVLWERALSARPGGKPLVQLELFRAPGFTWGTVLAGFSVFAMSGLLFALPQFFQAVTGADAMGAGLRLLPLVGGLIVGAIASSRVAARIGARGAAILGFALLTGGLAAGTTTAVATGFGAIAAWLAVTGAGMGFALSSAVTGALAAFPAERSGTASSLMQAVQKIGLPFGTAILGAVFNTLYRSHLDVAGIPTAAAEAARNSVFAGIAAAGAMKSAPFMASVRAAFVHGMSGMLWVGGATAAACIVMAALFLPGRAAAAPGVVTPGAGRVE